jgi:type IV pilus assembly protein PilC
LKKLNEMGINISQISSSLDNSHSKKVVEREVNSILKKEFSFGKILTDKRKEEFYSELVILLQSGLDLKVSLDIYINGQPNQKVKKIFSDVLGQIIHGASFSEAIKQWKEFSLHEYFSIRIGEESGRLMEVLEELSLYFRKKLKQHKQIVGAFSYPAVIFLTAILAVIFMMNFIVPMFADSFKRFNGELPGLTIFIINISNSFRHWWWIVLLLIGGIFALFSFWHKKKWFRRVSSNLILKLPLFGNLVRKVYLARFCQSMALMTGAKTPLIQSLDLVGRMMGLYPFEVAIKSIQEDIYRGKLLYEAMAPFNIFEMRMISLIKVGEETNRLDDIFKRLYEQYSEETDHQTAMLSNMLEPLLIVMIGGLVAVILVAMYLPMFKLGGTIMGM